MSPPLVSVVIGTFNSELFLNQTLTSVFAQTFEDFEVIVIDNLSKDRTLDIARSYGDRVQIRVMDHDCLPGVTRNEGVRMARGKYVAFLDSDDAWRPTKLERQVAFMEAHPDTILSHTYAHIINEESELLFVRHEGTLPKTGRCHRELLKSCFITLSSVMVRKSLVDQGGFAFPSDPTKDRTGEEQLYFILLARDHVFGLIEDDLTLYRRYASSISGRIGWKIVPENAVVLETILTTPAYWQGLVPRSEVRANFEDACLNNCTYWRDRGDVRRSSYMACWALRHHPASGRAWTALAKSLLKPLAPAK